MKALRAVILVSFAAAIGWVGYGFYLQSLQPRLEIRVLSALAVGNEKVLPFYELMSPVPPLGSARYLPKLEYKKGPPDRFIEKITVVIRSPENQSEKIVYYGRRSLSSFLGMQLLGLAPGSEAKYLETALRFSQGEPLPTLTALLLRPILLKEALAWTKNAQSLAIMDQAGTPAFLIQDKPLENGRVKSMALFFRRNSLYRMDYVGDRGYAVLDPETLFRKSFLSENRTDALSYLAKNLSEIRLEQKSVEPTSIAWPILLLAANVSVDPSSIDAYFHFAGISALLYRSSAMDSSSTEILDLLRNNVLASEFYAKDVDPKARKTLEIGRLARMLTRNFE